MPHQPGHEEDTLANLFGQDWLQESAFTPAQQFRQYATQTTAPGSVVRDALYSMQNPMLQQYYLSGLPGTQTFGGGGVFGQGFRDYMPSYSRTFNPNFRGEFAPTTDLRDVAQEIAKISQMTAGPATQANSFLQYLENAGNTNPFTADQAAVYRQIYGEGRDAEENRRQLANLVALQRPQNQGMYGGIVGRALSSVLNELYDAYTAQNPEGNFLNYFLQRTDPDAGGLSGLFPGSGG